MGARKNDPKSDPFFQKRKSRKQADENIVSDDSVDSDAENRAVGSGQEFETNATKRIRIAKEYLSNLKQNSDDDSGAEAEDRAIIAKRLRDDQLEAVGKLFRSLSDRLAKEFSLDRKVTGHALSVTAVALSDDGTRLFTASKDCRIVVWNAETLEKISSLARGVHTRNKSQPRLHCDQITCLALSTDGKYLVSGSQDKTVNVYDATSTPMRLLRTFTSHLDAIAGVVFRRNSSFFFSASLDRTVRLWNAESLSFVETFYGHQEGVIGVDSLIRERCVSVAGRDRSLHLYKILDESQLIFRCPEDLSVPSFDCVRLIDEDNVCCGCEDG